MDNNPYKRLLLIDDDAFIVQLLSLLLTQAGYDIITATNGKEAMDILNKQPVALIIVDLMMPEMDGLAFLQWLRQEALITIPAFVLTGIKTAHTEQQVMAAGATALFYKPIKAAELLTKIRQFEQT